MRPDALYRAAAIEAERTSMLGDIVVVPPVSNAILAATAAVVAVALASFLYWGTFTAHATLVGQLVPEPAVVKVHSPQAGVIVQRRVREGQLVRAGDLLFVVSSERLGSDTGPTREAVAATLEARRHSLEGELERTLALERSERAALERAATTVRAEGEDLESMVATQRVLATMAAEQASRYAALHQGGFVSREQLIARQQDAAEQRVRTQALQRERRQAARQLAELISEIDTLPARYGNRSAELERALAALRQEQAENDALRSVLIVAPTAGIATGIAADAGQPSDASRPLVSIVPAGAILHAELYAPSRAVGFVEPGNTVLLRYRAYPYQKFGHHLGTVLTVSQASFPASELAGAAGLAAQPEPLFRLTVALPAQSIEVYGRAQPLQAGMTVDGDVLQETRRLYEWALEPLYSLRRLADNP